MQLKFFKCNLIFIREPPLYCLVGSVEMQCKHHSAMMGWGLFRARLGHFYIYTALTYNMVTILNSWISGSRGTFLPTAAMAPGGRSVSCTQFPRWYAVKIVSSLVRQPSAYAAANSPTECPTIISGFMAISWRMSTNATWIVEIQNEYNQGKPISILTERPG